MELIEHIFLAMLVTSIALAGYILIMFLEWLISVLKNLTK
jgi:hypothetical protein